MPNKQADDGRRPDRHAQHDVPQGVAELRAELHATAGLGGDVPGRQAHKVPDSVAYPVAELQSRPEGQPLSGQQGAGRIAVPGELQIQGFPRAVVAGGGGRRDQPVPERSEQPLVKRQRGVVAAAGRRPSIDTYRYL